MSGVGLVGLAADGNENRFLNNDQNTLFQLRNEDMTIQHFSIFHSGSDLSGPTTVSSDGPTQYVMKLPMEHDGIGAGFISFELPGIESTRQEGISWNESLLPSLMNKIQLKSNKNIINERTGKQILLDMKTKLNTTRYALVSRLMGMRKEQNHPHTYTYTDRQMNVKHPKLLHTAVRTHSALGLMVDRPVDIGIKQSSPVVRDDLLVQHLKMTKPESFFTGLGTTKSDFDLNQYYIILLSELNSLYNTLSSLSANSDIQTILNQNSDLWNIITMYADLKAQNVDTVPAGSLTTVIEETELKNNAKTAFIQRKRDELQVFWKLWQEVEAEWTRDTYIPSSFTNTIFKASVSSITSPGTISGDAFEIYLNEPDTFRSITKDSSSVVQVQNSNYYLFKINRDFGLNGIPNLTTGIVGQLNIPEDGSAAYISVHSNFQSDVNATIDTNKQIFVESARHIGFTHQILDYVDGVTGEVGNKVAIKDRQNILVDTVAQMEAFESDNRMLEEYDFKNLVIGNISLETNYRINYSATPEFGGGWSGEKGFLRISNTTTDGTLYSFSTYENQPIMLKDPTHNSLTYQPEIKPLFEMLQKIIPTTYSTDLTRNIEYHRYLENNATVIQYDNMTDYYDTGGLSMAQILSQTEFNQSLQDTIGNTWATNITIDPTSDKQSYSEQLKNSVVNVFGSGFISFANGDYQTVFNSLLTVDLNINAQDCYIHALNESIIRIKNMEAFDGVQVNTSAQLITDQLMPKVVYMYGKLAYNYNASLMTTYVRPIYELLKTFSQTLETSYVADYSGSSGRVNTLFPTDQFDAAILQPIGTFTNVERNRLMEQIDYGYGTRQFISDLESGCTTSLGLRGSKYNVSWFKLADTYATPQYGPDRTADEILSSTELRFVFWYRFMDFMDKCRLVKEAWINVVYDDSNYTYSQNLDRLADPGIHNLPLLTALIQFYDQVKQRFSLVYDEYRVRAPSLTQQNLPILEKNNELMQFLSPSFTNELFGLSQEYDLYGNQYQGIDSVHTNHIRGVLTEYKFPQISNQSFNNPHTYVEYANVSISTSSVPEFYIVDLLEGMNSNVSVSNVTLVNITSALQSGSSSSSTDLFKRFSDITVSLLNDTYFDSNVSNTMAENAVSNATTKQVWSGIKHDMKQIIGVLEANDLFDDLGIASSVSILNSLIPNASQIMEYPTKQEGGYFHSKLGSTIGYIIPKEYSTGIPYEGLQPETEYWSEIGQYSNRVANIASENGPYESYSLSSSDIYSFAMNSTGINLTTFWANNFANATPSPQVFGYKLNLNNPLPLDMEPKTYRSYNYRIPKYIQQDKWEGCEQSLKAIIPNPLLQYFDYLRINMVHPDDVPSALMATNYGEIISQQDDPWIVSLSKRNLTLINEILSRDNKTPTNAEEAQLLREVGFRQERAAKVIDPVTNNREQAVNLPLIISEANPVRNPIRNEQVFDMNLKVLYRSYIKSQNVIDSLDAYETPNYIPNHIGDLIMKILLRASKSMIGDSLVEVTPLQYFDESFQMDIPMSSTILSMIENHSYMIQEVRDILTQFLRIVHRNNIPIENHKNVKTGYNMVWLAWKNAMIRNVKSYKWEGLVKLALDCVGDIYEIIDEDRRLNYASTEVQNTVWYMIMEQVLDVERAFDFKLDKNKTDQDWYDSMKMNLVKQIPQFVNELFVGFEQNGSSLNGWRDAFVSFITQI